MPQLIRRAHDLVADHVEFFLVLTLNVFRSGQTQNAGKRSLGDFPADILRRVSDGEQQRGELVGNAVLALFAGEILMKSHQSHV